MHKLNTMGLCPDYKAILMICVFKLRALHKTVFFISHLNYSEMPI